MSSYADTEIFDFYSEYGIREGMSKYTTKYFGPGAGGGTFFHRTWYLNLGEKKYDLQISHIFGNKAPQMEIKAIYYIPKEIMTKFSLITFEKCYILSYVLEKSDK